MTLHSEISDWLDLMPLPPQRVARFRARLAEGAFTRDENPTSHFCVYFLPIDPDQRLIFYTHHRKAGKWISPGGHIDRGETSAQALAREVDEELGLKIDPGRIKRPFLLTITQITGPNAGKPCLEHFDLWHFFPAEPSAMQVDMGEFYEARWMSIDAALALTPDANNHEALTLLRYRLNWK